VMASRPQHHKRRSRLEFKVQTHKYVPDGVVA
jgi:hypothetical protein